MDEPDLLARIWEMTAFVAAATFVEDEDEVGTSAMEDAAPCF